MRQVAIANVKEAIEGDIAARQEDNLPVPEGNFGTLLAAVLGAAPLFIIEVQSGSDLGEDDIERLGDRYDRRRKWDAAHTLTLGRAQATKPGIEGPARCKAKPLLSDLSGGDSGIPALQAAFGRSR